MKSLLVGFCSLWVCFAAFAHPYYGEDFLASLPQLRSQTSFQAESLAESVTPSELKNKLFKILIDEHRRRDGQPDEIGHCYSKKTKQEMGECYRQQSYNYKKARKFVFGTLHLEQNAGEYFVTGIYCQNDWTNRDLGANALGPDRYPRAQMMNTEHLWPQSKFSKFHPRDTQKTDLHHLMPTESRINSIRGNHPFGEVEESDRQTCQGTRLGRVKNGGGRGDYFMPPENVRGDVARALFYFSTRYQMDIDPVQERFLRKWHREDPVSEQERVRHEKVFEVQMNRNPYIDFPELVDLIRNF